MIEVAETCKLSLKRISWKNTDKNKLNLTENLYGSVDPAPPFQISNVEKLTEILLDEEASLFERYRAMFSLRNLRSEESVLSLCKG